MRTKPFSAKYRKGVRARALQRAANRAREKFGRQPRPITTKPTPNPIADKPN